MPRHHHATTCHATPPPRHHATTPPRHHATMPRHATPPLPRHHATTPPHHYVTIVHHCDAASVMMRRAFRAGHGKIAAAHPSLEDVALMSSGGHNIVELPLKLPDGREKAGGGTGTLCGE